MHLSSTLTHQSVLYIFLRISSAPPLPVPTCTTLDPLHQLTPRAGEVLFRRRWSSAIYSFFRRSLEWFPTIKYTHSLVVTWQPYINIMFFVHLLFILFKLTEVIKDRQDRNRYYLHPMAPELVIRLPVKVSCIHNSVPRFSRFRIFFIMDRNSFLTV